MYIFRYLYVSKYLPKDIYVNTSIGQGIKSRKNNNKARFDDEFDPQEEDRTPAPNPAPSHRVNPFAR
jgi:hypothetical protein